MSDRGETKLIYPGLADFYTSWRDIAGTMVRVVVGIMFLMHVSGKFKIGAAAVATTYGKERPRAVAGVCLRCHNSGNGWRRLSHYRPVHAIFRSRTRN